MYKSIKKTVSQTTNGTYKRKDWHFDFERLPWVQWLDIEPLTKVQQRTFRLLYPILVQEINTKKPSSLLHYLMGRGVLFWQDVMIIRHGRLTDLEQNSPFLQIMLTRGQVAFKALIDGLRSRYGGWQGYLADMLEGKFSFIALRDMSDIYKIVCHDLIKVTPVGWSVLPRTLGLKPKQIEKVRRENKLLTNQLLHSLFLWTGQREDTNRLLNELLTALQRINRKDIATGVVMLLTAVQGMDEGVALRAKDDLGDEEDEGYEQRESSPRLESGISMAMTESSELDESAEFEGGAQTIPKGRLSRKSNDSGFVPSPNSSRRSASVPLRSPTPPSAYSPRKHSSSSFRKSFRKTPTLREVPFEEGFSRIQSGKVYSYALTPRKGTNVWEKRAPSILQMDYLTHPNHDNMFMDYLVYH